jgi:hypothetical protein
MGVVERTGVADAPPATVWQTNFVGMDWEKWDPDITGTEDVEGDMIEGATLVLVMKNGKKIKTIVSDVKENVSFTFSSHGKSCMGGFSGTFELIPEGASKTTVVYKFGLTGCLGLLVGKKNVITGTEGGLALVIKNAEDFEGTTETVS